MGRDQPEGSESGGDSEEPDDAGTMTEAVRQLSGVAPGDITDVLGVSPEECLLQLVAEHDGQLPQGSLVTQVPWSAATVSRLLATFEEQGKVVRIHAGRGKVVFLADQQREN